jgi:hypothetical protein
MSFEFLELLEHNAFEKSSDHSEHWNEIQTALTNQDIQLQQLKAESKLNNEMLWDIKERLMEWMQKPKNVVEKPVKREPKRKIPKVPKQHKKIKQDLFSLEALTEKLNLTSEQSEDMATLAHCFANLFFKQKCLATCFGVSVFFHILCTSYLNEDILEKLFQVCTKCNLVKNTLPSQHIWDTICNFIKPYAVSEPCLMLPELNESRNIELGSLSHQVYCLDVIREEELDETQGISDWFFTYLCLCVLKSGQHIRDSARLILLSYIRTPARVPEDVFDNGIAFEVMKKCMINMLYDQNICIFLNILFKLHKTRKWINFFQIYENVLFILGHIPLMIKNKQNRKLSKFRCVAEKLRKSEF